MTLTRSQELRKWVEGRSVVDADWQVLLQDMREFAEHWGLKQSAFCKSFSEDRKFIDLQIGVVCAGVASYTEARVWFNSFAQAYASAMHRAQDAICGLSK